MLQELFFCLPDYVFEVTVDVGVFVFECMACSFYSEAFGCVVIGFECVDKLHVGVLWLYLVQRWFFYRVV